jgi:flavodoxin
MKKFLATFLIGLGLFSVHQVKAEEGNMKENKVLVAYFSATGTTAKVADKLAAVTGADLFEIKPLVPYSDADLDWRNKESRSSVEMADRSTRPAIASKVEDMADYDVVFVGFPIWWYREPSIIDTFLEAYDFAGKTVVPFATSGSSGMGDSSEIMQALAPNAKVEQGKRFASDVSEEELKAWAEKWVK